MIGYEELNDHFGCGFRHDSYSCVSSCSGDCFQGKSRYNAEQAKLVVLVGLPESPGVSQTNDSSRII
ncbi:hypothetical protein CEE69_13560 [Rhodopirellula bahusiensis]|uniref:Uncharacterized protein n=1 Tax=Rhodopirellula bahusiensis TaxID=2014065 RepID=A0A2G1W768_9BACT|nr:hypothetical protein CEE69_13560 [Rhodopirellula bahusiensis]